MTTRGTSVARELQLIDLPILEIEPMCDFEFTLYVSQRRGGGLKTIDSVERLCELRLKSRYKLTVIDIDDAPEEAERSRVLATPMLVVHKPLPQRRVIGSFEHPEELARAMGIRGDSQAGGSNRAEHPQGDSTDGS